MMEVAIISTLASTLISVVAAYYIARKFGDVAGTDAAIKYEEKKAAKARISAIQALINETKRIRELIDHTYLLSGGVVFKVRLPTLAFETAFVSGAPGLSVAPELLDAVIEYLVRADTINSLVDSYCALAAGLGDGGRSGRNRLLNQMKDESEKLPEVLFRLNELLNFELGYGT